MSNQLGSTLANLQVGPGIVMVKAVGGNVPSNITPIEFQGLQSAGFDIDQKIVSASGQNKMPFDSAPVDMTIKGTMEMLALNGTVFSNIISGDSPTTGGNVESYHEEYTLTAVTVGSWTASQAYTVGEVITDGTNLQVVSVAGTSGTTAPTWKTTLGETTADGSTLVWVAIASDTGAPTSVCVVKAAQATNFAEDLGVAYQSNARNLATLGGAQGATLPAPPAQGEYVSAGTSGWYLFNSADATGIWLNYSWTSSTAVDTFPIQNHWIGWGPYCEVNMQFPYQSTDQQNVLVALHLLAVRFGSQKVKTKRDGYMTVTYDWEAYCPPNGVAGQFYLPN